jgi:hypothetical protein
MSHILHVSAGSVKETEDGNVQTIVLGAVSINPSELIPLVGEEVVLQTPGQKGRRFGGRLALLSIKDTKHGPEVSLKVVGATELNGLVGTNVTVEAAQMDLTPVQEAVEKLRPKKGSGIDSVTISTPDTSVTLKAKDEPAAASEDLENF